MGYFQVRYDSRVINYDRRGFIGLATGLRTKRVTCQIHFSNFLFILLGRVFSVLNDVIF